MSAPSSRGFLARPLSRIIWLVVVAVALILSGWSIYWIGSKFGAPRPLALFGSIAFDGACVAFCDYAVRHVSAGTRGGGFARTMSLLLLAASVTLNASHAFMSGHGPVAAIYFAMPAVVAMAMLEAHFRWVHSGLRPPPSQLPELPSFRVLTWLTHPGQAWERVKAAVEPGVDRPGLPSSAPELLVLTPELPGISPGTSATSATFAPESSPVGQRFLTIGDPQAIREWGRANGFKVGSRGAPSAEVTRAYHDAMASANGHGGAA
jgi:hypothetical protein